MRLGLNSTDAVWPPHSAEGLCQQALPGLGMLSYACSEGGPLFACLPSLSYLPVCHFPVVPEPRFFPSGSLTAGVWSETSLFPGPADGCFLLLLS